MEKYGASDDQNEVMNSYIEAQKRRIAEELAREDVVLSPSNLEINVEKMLGIVVVTSVLSVHPSTEMIEAVMATHQKKEPLLESCEKVIVCDKPKIAKPGKTKFKSGRVEPADVERYELYVKELERLCCDGKWPFSKCRVVVMEKYGGFGFSLKMGLTV
jgi:hypothetical protein